MVNRNSETNISGIFAAGDVVDTRFKQAITGVGEAVNAAYSAYQYIQHEEIQPTSDSKFSKSNSKNLVSEKEIKRIVSEISKK